MATFFEVKQFLCRLLGRRDVEDNNDDIVIEFRNGRYSRDEHQGNNQLVIRNSELQELYDSISQIETENLEMYSANEYEVAINMDYPMMRNQELSVSSEDVTNGVRYEIGNPTIKYCLFLLIQIKDAMNEQQGRNRMFTARLRRPVEFLFRYTDGDEGLTLQSLLPRLIGELSLQIKCTSTKQHDDFRKHKTSFVFDFMYRSGIALIEFSDIVDLFHLNNYSRDRFDLTQINTPPLREYTTDVVDYYKLALSSNDPYIKFISFYHIMEYFYDEVFKKKMVTDLKARITHPDFSYKNEDKVYEIALFVKNRLRMNDESGQGNELESLKYVLNEYVAIDDLKTRISNIDSSALQYYQTSKVTFCNAPILSWSDSQGSFTSIAKRIYFTRNSLVHSKSSKNLERYRPYKDEAQLQKEIPLVKAVAELIIVNSSRIM